MVKRTYTKNRVESEIEKIKRLFPLFDETKLEMESSFDGKILNLKTNVPALQVILRAQGFTET